MKGNVEVLPADLLTNAAVEQRLILARIFLGISVHPNVVNTLLYMEQGVVKGGLKVGVNVVISSEGLK